ncbi:hypothetical protein [Micromonospora sp. KC721]|uniref:hypothetical protein n=1 Tax=Micromonospora sp. KC721 TaxID=2530380 RepID=UPI00104297C5|nr:hypothetical protein [Micromonospora sp. KC721]TDB77086.1 hypothetical protein E1182_18040 [Micromonospora sp. KC721]
MLAEIENPLASAVLTWIPADNGGRRSGPPTAPVYSATAAFRLGDDTQPGWPAVADQVSILLQRMSQLPTETENVKVGFLFPELAAPFVKPGAEFVVLEGPKVVATGVIKEVFNWV